MDDRDLAATPAGTDGAGACPRCGAYKHTPRSPELKRDVTRRINRVVGQLGGIRAMVEEDRYCGDILIQLSAAEGAIREIQTKVYKTHMLTCVKDSLLEGDDSKLLESFDLLRRLK